VFLYEEVIIPEEVEHTQYI